jgi:hypothetical protein
LDVIELRQHRRRHFLARLLVARLQFGAALRQTLVPHHRAEIGPEMFQHQAQSFRETKNGVCRIATRIREMEDREIRAVNVVMPVDQEKLHALILKQANDPPTFPGRPLRRAP